MDRYAGGTKLIEAQFLLRVISLEAEGRQENAVALVQAEVLHAEGEADANRLHQGSFGKLEGYRRYFQVQALDN